MEQSLRERASMAEQLELLKGKYKKSLQELMHILKVNKSLKDCLDSQAHSLEQALNQRQKEVEQRYQKQVEVYQRELKHYKDLVAGETMQKQRIQQELREREEQLADARSHCQTLENQLQQLRSPAQPTQSQTLRTKLAGYYELSRAKGQLWEECQQLKERVSQLTLQLIQQRQRYRSDIFSKETEILRSKESEYEKLRTIESKYQLLESELNNYKTVEKYFEEEANSLFDEDTVYNGIRQQITRINEDFSKYQLQSSQLLLRKREEEAEKNRKIAELQREVSRLKAIEERSIKRQKEIEAERNEYLSLKQKAKQLQAQRDQQLQKNHVLQALTITDKHRVNSSISQRIKQFETRVKLLLQEGNLTQAQNQAQGLQQIVVLKGYIKELSELLRQSKKREEHLAKKHQNCKQTLSSAEEAYRSKIGYFKAKIKDYDALVGKLYTALQQKLKQRVPFQLQKEFNTAIGHYQQKMVQMSEQIIKLRSRVAELQSIHEGGRVAAAVEAQNQAYKEIISELSVRVSELEQFANKRDEAGLHLHQKDKLIDQLAQEVNTLNTNIAQNRQKEAKTTQTIQNYERRVARYREELQQKQRISTNLARNSIDTASLIQKVNYLEYQLAKAKNSKNQPTPKPDEFIKSLESKLSAQNQLLAEYKAQIDRLYTQLKTEKTEKHSSAVDQYSQISQLQQQIGQWEIRVLSLEKELHSREAQFKDELQILRFQNRALIEQLNSKHAEMMGYYGQLGRKNELQAAVARLPEMERYVAQLQRKNSEIIQRSSYQANELNASILALRTANLSLRNELQSKEDAVNELKHQLFNAELRSQKEKPITASMIASFSGSFSRDSEADREKQREKEKLLTTLVLLAAEAQSLRSKNQQLEAMYHQDLDKYREGLKQLQTRQMELCNSLQLSSQVHQAREVQSHTQISQQAISHLSQNSTAYLHQSQPQEAAIRSQQHHPEVQAIPSSASISSSPLRRRGVTVKKIG